MTQLALLGPKWQRWIAANLILNVPADDIARNLVKHGLPQEQAEREVHAVANGPYLASDSALVARVTKAEAVLGVLDDVARQSPRFGIIERKSNVSREEFLADYYSANRPIILSDLMHDWPGRTTWSPDYFKARFGAAEVTVTTHRDSDRDYELNLRRLEERMTLGEYVDMVRASGVTNDHYATARNHLFDTEGLRDLLDEIVMFPQYLDPTDTSGKVSLWFGPAGTITPLHHDLRNMFLAQVYGRKRVRLVPPTQLILLYTRDTQAFSDVDCENPDFEKHPLFARATVMDVILHPGEVLFLPVGWWHDVRSLDISISISYNNFIFPNDYTWAGRG